MSFVAICAIILVVFHSTDALATMAIDIGTEYMKVAIVKPGVPMEIALNRESQRKTPVVVSMRNDERLIGDPALSTAIKFPSDAFIFSPSIIGRSVNNPVVTLYKERFPFYKLVERDNVLTYETKSKVQFSVEEIMGMIFENAMETAQRFSENPIKDAVITVPPFFGQVERKAVMRAAEYAGVSVLQLMNANAAVALNFGIFRSKSFNKTAQYYMFFDMGSSSTIATVVSYQVSKVRERGMVEDHPQATILGVGYDETLGGSAFALRIRDHLAKAFNSKKLSKLDITKNDRAMAKLFKEANRIFRILSANKDVHAQVENVFDDKDFKVKVTRDEVETMCSDLFERVQHPVDSALQMAQIPLNIIKEVILMGGGTRIPKVQEILLAATQKTELGKGINTDEAAALGAVYQAAHLSPGFRVKRFVVKDATLFPLAVTFRGADDGKDITKTLFSLGNPFPQKKVMTFNKHSKDFTFKLSYGDLTHLTDFQRQALGAVNLANFELQGIAPAMEKFAKPGAISKGVKAHFKLDDSGIIQMDRVEAIFEVSPGSEAAKSQDSSSTLSKIGETIGNIFGSAKSENEEAKKEDDKNDKEKTSKDDKDSKEKSSDTSKSAGGSTTANSTTATNGTSSKNETAKVEVFREAIIFKEINLNQPEPSAENKAASKKKIEQLKAQDIEKKLLEKAKNELEAFIFETKDKLEGELYQKCSTEEERNNIFAKLREAQDWYDEQGMDTIRSQYTEKVTALRTLTEGLVTRVRELTDRPKALQGLRDMLNTTKNFLDGMRNMTGEGNVFTETELTSLSKLINETGDWQLSRETELKGADLTKEPPVRIEDIRLKVSALEREITYLLGKIKYWVPPTTSTPPVKDDVNSTTTTTSNNTNSTDDTSVPPPPPPSSSSSDHKDPKTDDTKKDSSDNKKDSSDEKNTKDSTSNHQPDDEL